MRNRQENTTAAMGAEVKVRMSQKMRDDLEVVALAGDRTVSQEIRRALRNWLDHHLERAA